MEVWREDVLDLAGLSFAVTTELEYGGKMTQGQKEIPAMECFTCSKNRNIRQLYE